MDRVEVNGYKFDADKKGLFSLILEGYDLEAELKQLTVHQIQSVDVNWMFHRGRIKDLEFLKGHPEIKRVWITGAKIERIDCSGLYYLEGLEEVGGDLDTGIDYSRFKMLKSLRVSWWKGFPDLKGNTKLNHLMLRSFNPKEKSLTALSLPDGIEHFELNFSNITDLDGLPAGIAHLQLAYIRNLQSLHGLESICNTLRSIDFQNCPHLTDYRALEECLNLNKVILDKCGEMASLGWTKNCKEMLHFVFSRTHIGDGDLNPLFRIPYVYFTNSSDYNHRMKEFDSYRWYCK